MGAAFFRAAQGRRIAKVEPVPPGQQRAIANLASGRFRVVGRVVPATGVARSEVDDASCVYLASARYERIVGGGMASSVVPVMKEVDARIAAYPFFVEDASGRVRIDPSSLHLETVDLHEDHGLCVERRLRVGEEVVLDATFAPAVLSSELGPYRGCTASFEPVPDSFGPPRLSFRTEPDMISAPDEIAVFFRAIGGALWVLGGTIAVVTAFF